MFNVNFGVYLAARRGTTIIIAGAVIGRVSLASRPSVTSDMNTATVQLTTGTR